MSTGISGLFQNTKGAREATKEQLKTTTALVLKLLTEEPKTRNSDSYLYFRVLNVVAAKHGIDLGRLTVSEFLLGLKRSPFPPFESVRRARQKLQRKSPELAACEAVEQGREENETVYKDYARGGVVG